MEILNYINGEWSKPERQRLLRGDQSSDRSRRLPGRPYAEKEAVDAAAKAASDAFPAWRRTPVQDRCQYLFKLRGLLRENGDEIAGSITNECGKTFEEAKAEMVRAYENVEVACGMPMMMKGNWSRISHPASMSS